MKKLTKEESLKKKGGDDHYFEGKKLWVGSDRTRECELSSLCAARALTEG